jgi:hypothetical protein
MTRKLQIVLCVAAAVGLGALATSPYAEVIDNSVFLIWAGLVAVLNNVCRGCAIVVETPDQRRAGAPFVRMEKTNGRTGLVAAMGGVGGMDWSFDSGWFDV